MAARPPTLVRIAGRRVPLREEVRELAARRELLVNLVRRDLTVRYKRSLLGFLWTFLNPLIFMVILTIVFGTLFAGNAGRFPAYILPAYLVLQFFLQTTTTAMTSMAWNGPILRRVYVPPSLFPLSVVLSGLVNLGLSYLPLGLVMALTGAPFSWALVTLLPSSLLLFLFVLGCSWALAAVAVYFDDVRLMYQAGSYIFMFLTPIFYPLEIVPERFRPLIYANPLYHFCELIRTPVFHGQLPSFHHATVAGAWAVGALLLGWLVIRRLSPGFFRHL